MEQNVTIIAILVLRKGQANIISTSVEKGNTVIDKSLNKINDLASSLEGAFNAIKAQHNQSLYQSLSQNLLQPATAQRADVEEFRKNLEKDLMAKKENFIQFDNNVIKLSSAAAVDVTRYGGDLVVNNTLIQSDADEPRFSQHKSTLNDRPAQFIAKNNTVIAKNNTVTDVGISKAVFQAIGNDSIITENLFTLFPQNLGNTLFGWLAQKIGSQQEMESQKKIGLRKTGMRVISGRTCIRDVTVENGNFSIVYKQIFRLCNATGNATGSDVSYLQGTCTISGSLEDLKNKNVKEFKISLSHGAEFPIINKNRTQKEQAQIEKEMRNFIMQLDADDEMS